MAPVIYYFMDSYFSRIIGEFTGNELSGLLLPAIPGFPFSDLPGDSDFLVSDDAVDEEPPSVNSGLPSDEPDTGKNQESYEKEPRTGDQRIPDTPVRERTEEMRKREPEATAGKERLWQEVAYPSMEKEDKETFHQGKKPDISQSDRVIPSQAEENVKKNGSQNEKDLERVTEKRGVMDEDSSVDRGKAHSVTAGKESMKGDSTVLPGMETSISHKVVVQVIKSSVRKSRMKKGSEPEVQDEGVRLPERREAVQEAIPDLIPSTPWIFPDRTKLRTQSRLVIGKLTVEIVRQEEQKPLPVQEREKIIYHHVPVRDSVPDNQPAIKVKYGLGQL